MLTFTPVDDTVIDNNNQTAYQRLRFDLVSSMEGVERTPYLDSVGIPTIGYGFNLRDKNILQKVLKSFGIEALAGSSVIDTFLEIANARYTDNSALRKALNNAITKQSTANRTTFVFSNGATGIAEMRDAFDLAVKNYDNVNGTSSGRVDRWLVGIPPSKERVVFVSLSYNGLINAGTMKNLRAAVLAGDRAEAWFQIRYESNGGASRGVGIAKRRIVESEIFSLYKDPSSVTKDEVRDAFSMLQRHREDILKEEIVWAGTLDAKGRTALVGARADYETLLASIPGDNKIKDFDQNFGLGVQELVTELNTNFSLGLNAQNVRPYSVYTVAATNTKLPEILDATRDDANEVLRNNILIGSDKGNTITAGTGDDIVWGGIGDDTLLGGSGNDTYVFKSGDGKDTIIDDGAGEGRIVVGGATLAGADMSAYKGGNVWEVGGVTYKLDAGHSKLEITGSSLGAAGSNSITIENFNAQQAATNGYLGIKLSSDTKLALSESKSGAANAGTGQSTITEGGGKSFTVNLNKPAEAGDTVTLHLAMDDSALAKAILGDRVVDADGATITLAAGQTSVSFALVQDGALTADMSGSLKVTYQGQSDSVESNSWGLTLKDSGETANTLNGDYTVKTETYKGSDRSRVNSVGVSTVVLRKDTQGYVRGDSLGSTLAADPNGVLVTDNVIYGSADADKINGLEGNDALTGNAGNDVIDGGAGDDLIGGGTGSDTIKGGDGNDFISSAANVQSGRQQMGPDDAWVTWGWKSGETILAKGATWGVTKKEGGSEYWDGMGNTITSDTAGDVVDAGAGNDHVFGSWGDDRIQGGEGDDALDGLAGADIIEGGDGVDVIRGDGMVVPRYLNSVAAQNHGADFIDGGAGDDSMEGQGGADEIFGGDGNDQIWGDSYGATDGQSYVAIQYHGDDYIDAESGDDYAEGGGGNDTLYGGEGNDVLWGDTSADLVTRPQDNAIWGNDTRLCHRRSKSICAPHKTHLPCIASVLRASPERGMV